MKRISALGAILAFGFIASANAAATQVYTYQIRGLSGYASAYSYDACGSTYFYFGANQGAIHTGNGGAPVSSDFAYVYWSRYNWCEFSFGGGYAYGDLSINGNPTRINASGTLNGWDFQSGGPVTLNVDVAIDATGNYFVRGESAYSFSTPWGSGHSRYEGTSADASLSGSIVVGGVDLLAATSYSYGSLSTANSGSVTLYHQ